MFCTNCGNQIESGQNFCTSCGSPASSSKKEIRKDVQKQANATTKKPWTTGRLIKYAVITIVVVGLLVLKFGIAAYNSVESDAIRTNDSGINALNSGDSDAAIQQFSEAAESATFGENKMNSLKNLAYAHDSEGNTREAIAAFKEALTYASDGSFEYYLISGEIAYLEANPQKALSNYNLAYEKQPNNFQINNALNLFYLDIEDLYPQYFDAEKAIPYALKAYQNSEPLMKSLSAQNLALAYYFNEDYSNAIKYLKLSDQSDPYTAFWLGMSYALSDDPVNAEVYLQRAVDAGVPIPPEVEDYLYY